MSVYELSRDSRGGPPLQSEQYTFHGVQAYIWRLAGESVGKQHGPYNDLLLGLGCDKLAEIEENIVLAFSESGGNDDTRLKVITYRAQSVRHTFVSSHFKNILLSVQTVCPGRARGRMFQTPFRRRNMEGP